MATSRPPDRPDYDLANDQQRGVKLPEMMAQVPKQEERDPWKHRSQGMRCRTCMWYVPKENFDQRARDYLKVREDQPIPPTPGRCRRHAPTMNGYPVVFESDWCGDHKLA
ncbi:MAG: hypothetical protein AB7V19_07490 [Candidatus Bipolaricaulia bacterium]